MRALGATLSKHGSSRPGIEMTASAVAKNHDGYPIFILFFLFFLYFFCLVQDGGGDLYFLLLSWLGIMPTRWQTGCTD